MKKISLLTLGVAISLSALSYAEINANNDTVANTGFTTTSEFADTPTDFSIAAERLAEAGDVFTQYNLGLMYYYGDGAYTDINKSVKWLTRAAEQGYADAQYHLGVMYNNYVKAPNLDYNQAMYWYKKAAAQNHADAQNNIGILYQNGQGVEQDLTIAKQWYTKSCENGFAEGCQNQQMLTKAGY